MKKLIGWLALVLSGAGTPQRVVIEPTGPASDGFKLHTNLSQLPPDIGVWLVKGKGEIVPVLQGIDFSEEKERGKWLPKSEVGGKELPWHRLIFMVTWINTGGL